MRALIVSAVLVVATIAVPAPAGAARASVGVTGAASAVSVVGSSDVDKIVMWVDRVCSDTELCVKVWSYAGPVTAAGECRSTSPTQAYCPLTGAPTVEVSLGAGDDDLDLDDRTLGDVGPWTFEVRGGDGNDRLAGPGAPSSGTWHGDDGDDTVVPDANVDGGNVAGRDDVRGGTGTDTVDYSEGPGGVGVTVSLDGRPNDGHGSDAQTDNVRGDVENVIGSAWNDTVTGGRGKNRLDGGSGRDDLRATGGGRDVLVGGPGRDRARVDQRDTVRQCEVVRRS